MMHPVTFANNGAVNTDNKPSPAVWGRCPFEELQAGRTLNGWAWHEEFTDFPLPGTQTTEISLPGTRWKVYSTTAGVWAADQMPHATTIAQGKGIISALTDTDGDMAVIGTHSCPFLLDTTVPGMAIWEARVALTSILTNMGQWFVGLGENSAVTFGAATPLANADALSTGDAKIGFNRLEDGLAVLNTSYADHAAAWTNIGASAYTALAANTWVKLAMIFDPKGDPLRCVRFFVNNVEMTTAMTRAALLALTHLDAKALGFVMAFFADSAGTANYQYIDWVRCAQWYEN